MVETCGGVILCGGRSQRMGQAKETLPFGDETMLARVLRLTAAVVAPVVVVAAPGQQLPELPSTVRVVRDRVWGRGPLEGLYCGLQALADRVEAAFVTSCDVPLLRGELVKYLCDQLDGYEAVVPSEGEFCHPLTAVYRTSLVDAIAQLLARDELRMTNLYNLVRTRRVDAQLLRPFDPELHSLMNINRPEDYQSALRVAGLLRGQ